MVNGSSLDTVAGMDTPAEHSTADQPLGPAGTRGSVPSAKQQLLVKNASDIATLSRDVQDPVG